MVPSSRKVDLNVASLAALLSLPQVGPKLARAIVSARPYHRLADLTLVPGVGKKLYLILKEHVIVSRHGVSQLSSLKEDILPRTSSSSGKLDLNSATIQELTTLPGVGEDLAEKIVGARPYGRLPELKDVRGVGPKLYLALRQHLSVPRSSSPIKTQGHGQSAFDLSDDNSSLESSAEIDLMPSFNGEHDDVQGRENDTSVVGSDPLEVETVQELIGPRIVDSHAPVRLDPVILEGSAKETSRLVTRELRRQRQVVDIDIGARSRRSRWRLLGAAVIAALLLSVMQAYGFLGDVTIPSVFSPPPEDIAIIPVQLTPSVTFTESVSEPLPIAATATVEATAPNLLAGNLEAATGTMDSLPATLTSTLTSTSTSTSTSTVVPTSTLMPSSTVTASASPTITPTATQTIAIPQSVRDLDPPVQPISVLWVEDFEPPKFPWGYERNEFWDSGIVSGVLGLIMQQRGRLFYSTGPAFDLAGRDFLYEGDVTVQDCKGKDFYGLLFKARLPDYYAATITCEGNYRFVRSQNEVYEDLLVAVSDAVPAGPGVYRLGVLLQGGGFSLYVNGEYVDRILLEELDALSSGEFGVLARSVESHQLQLEWDNLIVTELLR